MAARVTTRRPPGPSVTETLIMGLRIGFTPTAQNVMHWASWAITLGILLAMTAVLLDGHVYDWEVEITRWAQDVSYPDWAFTLTADRLTNSDTPEGALIIGAMATGLWLLRLRIEALLVLLSVPLHVLGNFPKAFVERDPPSEVIDGIIEFGGLKSFPSGHAEFAITFYGFLVYLAVIHVRSRLWKAALIVAFLGMVLAVGFARIEVGEHWPLDVVAGYVVGIGLLSGLIWLHRSLYAAKELGGEGTAGNPNQAKPAGRGQSSSMD